MVGGIGRRTTMPNSMLATMRTSLRGQRERPAAAPVVPRTRVRIRPVSGDRAETAIAATEAKSWIADRSDD